MGRITRMGPRITPITRISQFEFLRDHRVNLRALRGLKEFDFATNYAITHIGLLRGSGGG